MQIADAEGFNVHRRQHGSIRYRRECGGPPESSGRGMQEEMRRRTREAPEAPVGKASTGGSGDALHADGVSYQAYYSAVGKAHHTGKDLTEVRSLQRKLVPDKVGLEHYEPKCSHAP